MMMKAGVYIGNKIKELRISHRLSQAATAEALSMPLRTYQMWEKDFTSSVQNLIHICNYFEISVGEILNSIQERSTGYEREIAKQSISINMDEYKIRIFDLALEGKSEDEIFSWYEKVYPLQASSVTDKHTFITNCFLDIYHLRHKALTNLNFGRDPEKEKRIAQRFGLPADHIVVTKSGHIKHEIIREMLIARYGSEWIIDWAAQKPGLRVGLSNGFTIARILDYIPRGAVENLNLFPMNFTNSPIDFPISANALISSFMYKSTGYGIATDALNEEQVFSSMILADAVFLGIGSFSHEGLYEKMLRSVRGQRAIDHIKNIGVVGDLNYHFLDKSGKEVLFHEIVSNIGDQQSRSLIKSIGLRYLKEKADKGGRVVIAGSGEYKADAVRVSLENRYANYLITDETISDAILMS